MLYIEFHVKRLTHLLLITWYYLHIEETKFAFKNFFKHVAFVKCLQ